MSIQRHYTKLSEKETEELVGAFAELVVARVTQRGIPQPANAKPDDRRPDTDTTERS
jgi:hypothetical protein